MGERFAIDMAYTALVLVFHDCKIYSKILAVARRHNLGNEIFVGQSDGRETLKAPAEVLTVIDRDFFACKFCDIASSLGFCLKLPEAVSSASPRLGTIETIVLPWDADAPVAQASPGRRFALPWATSLSSFCASSRVGHTANLNNSIRYCSAMHRNSHSRVTF